MRNFNKSLYVAMGKRVKELRLDKKLYSEKFSNLVDISDKFLYDIKMGNKGISADTLNRISNAWGVSTDWLLKGEEFVK